MTAAVWTAIGILAALSAGTLFYLGTRLESRIESLGARLDGQSDRFDSLGARLDARFDSLGARLDARLDSQSERTDQIMGILLEHSRLLTEISARLDAHIGRDAS